MKRIDICIENWLYSSGCQREMPQEDFKSNGELHVQSKNSEAKG